MSSVDWKKLKGPEIDAMIYHAVRHDGKDVRYRNSYIDKEKTHLNYVIGPQMGRRFDGTKGRDEAQRLKRRVEEIDALEPPKRRRKDRVTAVAFCVSAPEGLSPEQERQFFEITYKHLSEQCGGYSNITRGYVHYDEVHDYIDPVTGEQRTSRPHLHAIGIPYVKGVGVNGFQFETRESIRALNRKIDEECKAELGIPFMTGRYQPLTGRSVEDLQAASVNAALKQGIAKAERDRDEALNAANEAEFRKQEAEHELEVIKGKSEKLRSDYSAIAAKYNHLVAAVNALLAKASELNITIDAGIRKALKNISR